MFTPVQITADAPLVLLSPSPSKAASTGEDTRAEITPPDGTRVITTYEAGWSGFWLAR